MNENRVEVYFSAGCRYCRIAKAKLSELRIPFTAVDISLDHANFSSMEIQAFRVRHAQSSTVPQIYIGQEHVGGCTELLNEVENGILAQRLERNKIVTETMPTLFKDIATQIHGISFKPGKDEPLNSLRFTDRMRQMEPLSASKLSHNLQVKSLQMMDEFASPDGRRIDYSRLRTSTAFASYVQLSCELQFCDLRELADFTHEEKIAFWSNLYNALIVHATCVLREFSAEDGVEGEGDPHSPEAEAWRSALFTGQGGAIYRIGGKSACFSNTDVKVPSENTAVADTSSSDVTKEVECVDVSADTIEHAILRANYPHPSQVEAAAEAAIGASGAGQCDPEQLYHTLTFLPPEHVVVRCGLSIRRERFDPRIHFALNCGARSCPPIKVLRAGPAAGVLAGAATEGPEGNIEAALGSAAAAYLGEEVRLVESDVEEEVTQADTGVKTKVKTLFLPRLLLWYGRDFGTDLHAVVATVAQLLPPVERHSASIGAGTGANTKKQLLQLLQEGAQYRISSAVDMPAEEKNVVKIEFNPYDWAGNNERIVG